VRRWCVMADSAIVIVAMLAVIYLPLVALVVVITRNAERR
jgi:hypothetical protein